MASGAWQVLGDGLLFTAQWTPAQFHGQDRHAAVVVAALQLCLLALGMMLLQ